MIRKGEKIMKTRNTFTNALALVALAVIVVLLVAAWQSRQVQAVQDSEDRPSDFGFIDLGAGQTARLNVVNLRRQPPPDPDSPPPEPDQPPPDPEGPGNSTHARRVRLAFDIYVQPPPEPDAPSCITRYRFLRRESCDVALRPGEAASFDFTAAQDMKVAASIHSLGGPDTREADSQVTPEPHLAPMLEVREGMRTLFVVPAVIKGFNPQPDPPGTP
jgi:hypothetical protein